jgi:hypothetical protein
MCNKVYGAEEGGEEGEVRLEAGGGGEKREMRLRGEGSGDEGWNEWIKVVNVGTFCFWDEG